MHKITIYFNDLLIKLIDWSTTLEAPVMTVSSWLRTQLAGQVFQNFVVGAICTVATAVGMTASKAAVTLVGGCPERVVAAVARGEAELVYGHTEAAQEIVVDVLVQEPKCACTNSLAAAVAAQRLRELPLGTGADERTALRKACYFHADYTIKLSVIAPRAVGLLTACAADGAKNFAALPVEKTVRHRNAEAAAKQRW